MVANIPDKGAHTLSRRASKSVRARLSSVLLQPTPNSLEYGEFTWQRLTITSTTA